MAIHDSESIPRPTSKVIHNILFFRGYLAVRRFDSEPSKLYHARLMSGPRTIDALCFARERQSLHGKIRLFDLTRLRESLANLEGCAEFRLVGGVDEQERSIITLSVHAALPMICWRCLEPMRIEVNPTTRFVLVGEESNLPAVEDEPEEWTALVALPSLDLQALVEDELILALPMTPSHPSDDCGPLETAAHMVSDGPESPFSALRALKRKRY
jgi:uncharacterized protein